MKKRSGDGDVASIKYKLKIVRDSMLVSYDGRLKTSRALVSAVHRNGLSHDNVQDAVQAAQVISKNPLVERVALVKVVESDPIIFRNGERCNDNQRLNNSTANFVRHALTEKKSTPYRATADRKQTPY